MQCDPHCSSYKACIPACPIDTCENLNTQGKDQRMCTEDTCVEGCEMKPCPEGEIFANNSYTECVPKAVCNPVCMKIDGKDYFEGDLTKSDSCHKCHCSKGKEVCIGLPCAAPTPTGQQDSSTECKSGWTDWINQDEMNDESKTTKPNIKIGDVEMLPSDFYLKNWKTSAFCKPEKMKQIECRSVEGKLEPKRIGEDTECSLERGLLCTGECHDYEIRVMCDCEDDIEVLPIAAPILPTSAPLISRKCEMNVAKPLVEKPGDCYKYLQCAPGPDGNEYVERECAGGNMFNPQSMMCDHAESVMKMKPDCLNVATSPMPPLSAPVPPSPCPEDKVLNDCAVPCGRACHYYDKILQKKELCTGTHNTCIKGCVSKASNVVCPIGEFWRDDRVCVAASDCTCMDDDGQIVQVKRFSFATDAN